MSPSAAELDSAIALREAGRYRDAVQTLQSLLSDHPQDAAAHALLAQVLQLDKQDGAAWSALNTALSIEPDLAIVQQNYARLLLRRQMRAEALQAAQAAYRLAPADPECQLVLATALGANNRAAEAPPLFEAALRTRPDYAEAWANRALFKLRTNDFAGALADAETALSLKPHLPQLWGVVGSLRLRSGNLPGAIDALEKALAQEPDNVGHMVALGDVKRRTGQLDAAIKLLRHATSIAPGDAGAWLNLGAALQQSQRTAEARAAYAKALEIAPDQPEVLSNLGALARQERNWEEALRYFDKALERQPGRPAILTNRAATLIALGRHELAERAAEAAIEADPAYLEARFALAETLTHQQRYGEARKVLDGAAELGPTDSGSLHQLAFAYAGLFCLTQSWADAADWARRAQGIRPGEVKTLRLLGLALDELGQDAEAGAAFDEALQSAPEDVDILRAAIGHHARHQRWIEAESLARRVAALRPDADAMRLIARGHARREEWGEAESWARKALELKHDDVDLLYSLAKYLLFQDNILESLRYSVRFLKLSDRPEARALFISCVKSVEFTRYDPDVNEMMIRALAEPWGRPGELTRAAATIVKLDPVVAECLSRCANVGDGRPSAGDLFGPARLAALSRNRLLCTLLSSAPNTDLPLERLLTLARRALLDAAAAPGPPNVDAESGLGFYCALAHQCFINEYVFADDDDETNRADALAASLVEALASGAAIPPLWPVAVAAYLPLHRLANASRLLERDWPPEAAAVLARQVREPAIEADLRATIPRLGAVEDDVSRLVQQQYEDNPYPRWINIARGGAPTDVGSFVKVMFPRADLKPISESDPEILIAGCGTGQHPIGTAQMFRGARVCAVDLSLASLSYAKRKTQEMGLSIEYMQADLLQLGELDRTFDIIESAGVLHHLRDPFAGWRVLVSLLRPHGLMKIALYSETARRDVVTARAIIADQGYGATADEIRRCRQYLLDLEPSKQLGNVTKSVDFYSLSGCRDLLFHVQEHRMTLPQISAFLRAENLNLLGFAGDPAVPRAYVRRFPNDPAAVDLDQWRVFEEENPNTFFGMYQIWLQKND